MVELYYKVTIRYKPTCRALDRAMQRCRGGHQLYYLRRRVSKRSSSLTWSVERLGKHAAGNVVGEQHRKGEWASLERVDLHP
jgi:hypothetical protein